MVKLEAEEAAAAEAEAEAVAAEAVRSSRSARFRLFSPPASFVSMRSWHGVVLMRAVRIFVSVKQSGAIGVSKTKGVGNGSHEHDGHARERAQEGLGW